MDKSSRVIPTMKDRGIEIFLVLMSMILFTPAFPLPGGLPSVRIEELLLPVILVLLWQNRTMGVKVIKQPMTILFVLLGISMGISIGNAAILQGGSVSLSDLMELIRVLKYLVLYVFMVTLIASSQRSLNREEALTGFVNISVVLFLGINWAQYFNFLYFNRWFSPLFGPPHHVERIIRNSRVIGTLGNPNFFGALMMIFLLFYFSKLIFQFDQMKLKPVKWTLLISAAWMSLLLTASRTALLAVVGGFAAGMAVYLLISQKKHFIRLAGIFALVILLGLISNILVVFTMRAYDDYLRPRFVSEEDDGRRLLQTTHTVGNRMQEALNEGRGIRTRLQVWSTHFEYAKESLIIGNGPQKEEFRGEQVVDNEYLLILRRYGMLGLVLYGSLYVHNLFKRPKGYRSKWYYTFLFSSTLSLLAFNLPAGSFYHLQLFPAYIGFIAMYDGNGLRTSQDKDQ